MNIKRFEIGNTVTVVPQCEIKLTVGQTMNDSEQNDVQVLTIRLQATHCCR